MKPLLLLFAVSFGFPAAAQTPEHSVLHELATTADVIAVAKLREPQMWSMSELIVMTGHATALVERTLKGESLPSKITVQVVRQLDVQSVALERPQEPNAKGGAEFPVTPAAPSKFIVVEDTDQLKSAAKVFVFLRRAKDGTLNAVDGFVYTFPYSTEAEGMVSSLAKKHANKPWMANPTSPSVLDAPR